jgi:circadian clock protein KaiC
MKKVINTHKKNGLRKSPTGIRGFDEITFGGLPSGRPTLVCGNSGCGKTLFGMEFIIQGAIKYNEPGVFVSFEEKEDELIENVDSLGFNLSKLIKQKKVLLEHVHVELNEIDETGGYNLEGLFIRLNYAIESIGAKRVVLDTIESLFSGPPNALILRSELRRLFRWLKDKGVTAIITGERGDGSLTRQGLEEYVSDCVVLLDHRVTEQTSIRRMRVVKYRGTVHGTNEYPFIIDESGFSVLPLTSSGLNHDVSTKKISCGVTELDKMLGGKGFYRGSSILVSGRAGSGKSSFAAQFSSACCSRGERVLYFSFEESPAQRIRNMKSIGIDLKPSVEKGLLRFHAMRPTMFGLETHLAMMHKAINDFKPHSIVVDPLNSFDHGNNANEVKSMLIRFVDFCKASKITGLFTSLNHGGNEDEFSDASISSLIDTWILLRDIETYSERNRAVCILKSRGMKHSNKVREFLITDHGMKILDIYQGPDGVLSGSARIKQTRLDNIKKSKVTIKKHKSKTDKAGKKS